MKALCTTAAGLAVFILHLLFLSSVFDIYFRSPVVKSGRTHTPAYPVGQAPAKRLVLIVADGLRADSLFANEMEETPYLAKVRRDLGRWGVSHTRVPTESRPGHIALIAGMYEDPSAITRGWQENPVDFDTVFNASRHTWSWGSPDILPMFAKGATGDRVSADFYAPEFEDFSAGDPSDLDQWVFDKVTQFLDKSNQTAELRATLRQDKLVLFLHLLGLDINGHTNKPNSPMYLKNLRLVDRGVQNLVQLAENYWGHDLRTAYVFTSDHGMTDWGSHGAGTAHETHTPLLCWGAGIKPAAQRTDVNQTDVAALMSSLLGISMPQNSVGKVPEKYLKLHPSMVLQAKVANVLQLHEQVQSFREKFETAVFHSPFQDMDAERLERVLNKAKSFGAKNQYDLAFEETDKAFEVCMRGLTYYQRYHRTNLYVATTASYLGFILLLVVRILKEFTPFTRNEVLSPLGRATHVIATAFLSFGALIFTLVQRQPLLHFVHYAAAILVWSVVTHDLRTVVLLTSTSVQTKWTLALKNVLVPVVVLEFSIGAFFERRLLSAAILINMVRQLDGRNGGPWIVMNLVLSAFSFQPSVSNEKSPALAVLAGILSAFCVSCFPGNTGRSRLSALLLILSGLLVYAADHHPTLCHWFAWSLLLVSVAMPFLSEPILSTRLAAICTGLQTVYILLSVTYEGLFSLSLMLTLLIWTLTEHRVTAAQLQTLDLTAPSDERSWVNLDDVSTALNVVFFTLVSFFGVGNLASINSFNPKSIQTLVSVFNPFLMGSLLLLKVVLPFFMVAVFASVVSKINRTPRRALFLMVLLLSDFMALHFFFLVTDQGSWQEIGTSLSHYVIAQATVIFLQILTLSADALLRSRGVWAHHSQSNDLQSLFKSN